MLLSMSPFHSSVVVELLFVLVFVLSLITKCLIIVNVIVIALHQGGSLVEVGPHGVRQMVVNPVV